MTSEKTTSYCPLDSHSSDLKVLTPYLTAALELKYCGNSITYDRVVHRVSRLMASSPRHITQSMTMTTPHTSSDQDAQSAVALLHALSQVVSILTLRPELYDRLLHHLFSFSYAHSPSKYPSSSSCSFSRAYERLVCSLVSANSTYILPACHMLCRQLSYATKTVTVVADKNIQRVSDMEVDTAMDISTTSTPLLRSPGPRALPPTTQQVVALLLTLLKLVPAALTSLGPLLTEYFPHRIKPTDCQVVYVTACLFLIQKLPALRSSVLALLLDQLVLIDVEIKLDDSEPDLLTMDDFLEDAPSSLEKPPTDMMADKLDRLMALLLGYLTTSLTVSPTALGPSATQRLFFTALCRIFQRGIFHTHRVKYPQFLLFVTSALHPSYTAWFLNPLVSAITTTTTRTTRSHTNTVPDLLSPLFPLGSSSESSESSLTALLAKTQPLQDSSITVTAHLSAAAYVASFVARAAFVPLDQVQSTLSALMNTCLAYIAHWDTFEPATLTRATPSTASSLLLAREKRDKQRFIITFQTLCYIACFRGVSLTQQDPTFLPSFAWQRCLECRASPLCAMNDSVAHEFLNLADVYQLISLASLQYWDSALMQLTSSGSSASLLATSQNAKTFKANAPLRSPGMPTSLSGATQGLSGARRKSRLFFPFDPYLLRHSFPWVGPLYLFWKDVDPLMSNLGASEDLNVAEESLVLDHRLMSWQERMTMDESDHLVDREEKKRIVPPFGEEGVTRETFTNGLTSDESGDEESDPEDACDDDDQMSCEEEESDEEELGKVQALVRTWSFEEESGF